MLHKHLVNAVIIAPGTRYASAPMRLTYDRHCSFHLLSTGAATGGAAKLQGSNVDAQRSDGSINDALLAPGGVGAADTGWVDLDIGLTFGAGVQLNKLLPAVPGGGAGGLAPFDTEWVRIVVDVTGPGPTTLDVYAKAKGAGG